ncbi:HAD family hydrolase [Motilimonas eburnea]|uniref:HAD family hydrolase n=1 Tax=Motilimonas eburnea TaxID=1737488 RepID=UPI001E5D0BB5|nr:HAD family hydrolase [Motilimonas eburnea]MCE2570875.1 HAD family hydrolase [Motilimonas eburnea]
MQQVYLFDWGDTLMADFPNQSGKMCDWPNVAAVDGAVATLAQLSQCYPVYIATNAADSSESEIQAAFARVGLDKYLSGYFCRANLGVAKGTPEFFHRIIKQLNVAPHTVLMVGDSLQNDVLPAIAAGLQGIWFNPRREDLEPLARIKQINALTELVKS